NRRSAASTPAPRLQNRLRTARGTRGGYGDKMLSEWVGGDSRRDSWFQLGLILSEKGLTLSGEAKNFIKTTRLQRVRPLFGLLGRHAAADQSKKTNSFQFRTVRQ